MKKVIIFLPALFLFCFSHSLSAQGDVDVQKQLERKMEFFAEQLELEDEQREQFIDIYRENFFKKFEEQRREMDKGQTEGDFLKMQKEKIEGLSEEEAVERIMLEMEHEQMELDQKKESQLKLMKAIGAKNLLKLQILKKEYKMELERESDGSER